MSPVRPQSPASSRAQGALAWLLASVVFALGLLTVSPTAHAHLHGKSTAHESGHAAPAAHDDSGCAVTLFQQGVTVPLDLPRIDTPSASWMAMLPAARDTLALSAPRHLLRPARGPPWLG